MNWWRILKMEVVPKNEIKLIIKYWNYRNFEQDIFRGTKYVGYSLHNRSDCVYYMLIHIDL